MSNQGLSLRPCSRPENTLAKIQKSLQVRNINKLKIITHKIMTKKNQHWEVVFRMQTQDEWMWKNLPFTLKFEDKESAEKKYKEIVDDIVENGHGSWPGLEDSYSNKIIEEKEYNKSDSFCRLKSTTFEITMYTEKPYKFSVELCEYNFSIDGKF